MNSGPGYFGPLLCIFWSFQSRVVGRFNLEFGEATEKNMSKNVEHEMNHCLNS